MFLYFYLTIEHGPQKSIWAAGAKLAPTSTSLIQIYNNYIRNNYVLTIMKMLMAIKVETLIMNKADFPAET